MKRQFLKDHLLDFEVVSALGVGALLKCGFGTSWLIAILLALSVFALMPLLLLLEFHLRAFYLVRQVKKLGGKDRFPR